jgi:hypothetical protein
MPSRIHTEALRPTANVAEYRNPVPVRHKMRLCPRSPSPKRMGFAPWLRGSPRTTMK